MKKNANSCLVISKEEFCQKVNTQIAIAKKMLSRQITSDEALFFLKNEITNWSRENENILKYSFDNFYNEFLAEYKDSYLALGNWGTFSFSITLKTQHRKISSYIKGLEKILDRMNYIPLKGVA